VTGDLDFVGPVPASAARQLVAAGFEHQGRHWLHEAGQVYLELPSGSLDPEETAVRLQLEGFDLLVISPEDLLAERLGGWQRWRSAVDGVNAWLLERALGSSLDRRRLSRRCRQVQAAGALNALLERNRCQARYSAIVVDNRCQARYSAIVVGSMAGGRSCRGRVGSL